MAKDDLTIEKATADFKRAYKAKSKLIERQKNDFLFALGEQWSKEDIATLDKAGLKPVTDNRIAPNIFLLTGLERQNRTEFKAFPEGEEDGVKAEIASALFKDCIKKSGFLYKSSEQFKDGITCGESHIEFYLDYTEDLLNGKPCWNKCDSNSLFPDPASREYDFSDAKFVDKIKLDVAREDLINLYPDSKKALEQCDGSRLDMGSMGGDAETHRQPKDYPKDGSSSTLDSDLKDSAFDLVEHYYKKWVDKFFVGDKKTGEINEAESLDKAEAMITDYKDGIVRDQQAYEEIVNQHVVAAHGQMVASMATPPAAPAPAAAPVPDEPAGEQFGETTPADTGEVEQPQAPVAEQMPAQAPIPLTPDVHGQIKDMLHGNGQLPPPPPHQDPERFILIKRMVPEIWCFAYTPGLKDPLANERAWFYPKWKSYPFAPYFARFSTAPLTGAERHLLVQGIVHGVKGAQEKHNRAEMLMIRHLNTSANSGWLSEEDVWVDPEKVKMFGTSAGVNLEYKQGRQKPERITPSPLSQAHAQISMESAESIKAQLGMNADLLATQQGGADSGRAIALRQKQGLLMVQELFDNHSRTRQIAGRFLLSQMGEMYDTETAMKVLGEAWLTKNFPPLMLMNPQTQQQEPMAGEDGQPMQYDKEMATLAITEVLSGTLDSYNVSVGEAVASESQKMAVTAEMNEIAKTYPGLIPPSVVIQHSQLPESAKAEILTSIQQAQAAAAGQPPSQPMPGK